MHVCHHISRSPRGLHPLEVGPNFVSRNLVYRLYDSLIEGLLLWQGLIETGMETWDGNMVHFNKIQYCTVSTKIVKLRSSVQRSALDDDAHFEQMLMITINTMLHVTSGFQLLTAI